MSTDVLTDGVFEGKEPNVKLIYNHLLEALRTIGTVNAAPKQSSIHLEKTGGFAGVHPRKNYINLEFRTDYQIENSRITRTLKLSARRYEHTVKLTREGDVDAELLAWLKDAYDLAK